MTSAEKLELLNPIRYVIAPLIFIGGIMHLIGLLQVMIHGQSLPGMCWFFYLFAIFVYPPSAAMIFKNISWGYWITAVAPSVGGLFISIGFFFPNTRYLTLLAGTVEREITWFGFMQVISESMAVAGAVFLICHKIWQLGKADQAPVK